MILLTGASGFLGKALMEFFKGSNILFTSIGRSPLNSIQCDLSGTIPVLPLSDMVVHAAGKAHVVPKNDNESNDFYTVNVKGTQNLLSALENDHTLRRFIFISSVSVYGLVEGININEHAPVLATDPYGKSKLAAEKIVVDWCKSRNINYYILRLPIVAGKDAPGNLGAMVKGIKTGRYFSIGKATAKKSMILASDLASFIPTIQGLSGIYNLTDGYHPSFSELENSIATFYNKKRPFALPGPAAKVLAIAGDILGGKFPVNSSKLKKITSTLTFDDSKARGALQWNPNEVLKAWQID